MPHTSASESIFHLNSSLRVFAFEVTMLEGGYLLIRYSLANVSFTLQWANPAWEWMAFDPSAQLEEVQKRLEVALRGIPGFDWHKTKLDPIERATLLQVEATWSQFMCNLAREWWYGKGIYQE